MAKQFMKRVADSYKWACGWLPMFRRTHKAYVDAIRGANDFKLSCLRRSHHEEIAETLKLIDGISQRAAKIDFTGRLDEYYTLHLILDPRLWGGFAWDEQKLMARHIAHRVEVEIATSKFVEKAADYRHRQVA